MRAEYTEEQGLLRETLSRLLADAYDFETRRALAGTAEGWSRDLWSSLAELGLLAALAPEDADGLGGGGVEAMLIAEALGAALSAEPYAPTAAVAAPVLAAAGRSEAVASLISGEGIAAWVDAGGITVRDGALYGAALSQPWADTADHLLIAAEGADGATLVWLSADQPGVTRRAHRTFDGLAAADLTFEGAALADDAIVASGAAAEALIGEARARTIAWLAAEATGLMDMALTATVEHLKSRVQFGQTLAGFQALQHRAAEMLIALEQGRSAAILAAGALSEPDARRRALDLASAKLVVSDAARTVAQAAVQLHGGIGVTEEHKIGWAFRRLTMIEHLCGDADVHAARLADLGGYVDAD